MTRSTALERTLGLMVVSTPANGSMESNMDKVCTSTPMAIAEPESGARANARCGSTTKPKRTLELPQTNNREICQSIDQFCIRESLTLLN